MNGNALQYAMLTLGKQLSIGFLFQVGVYGQGLQMMIFSKAMETAAV